MRALIAIHGVRFEGRRREPGEPFAAPDAVADDLIMRGAATADPAEDMGAGNDPDRAAQIAAAIAGLGAGDLTQAGQPKVDAVRTASGLTDVSAAEIEAVVAANGSQAEGET